MPNLICKKNASPFLISGLYNFTLEFHTYRDGLNFNGKWQMEMELLIHSSVSPPHKWPCDFIWFFFQFVVVVVVVNFASNAHVKHQATGIQTIVLWMIFDFRHVLFFGLVFFYFSLLKWIHMYNYANELASDTHSYVLHAWNIQLFLTFFSSPGIWQAWLIFIDFWKLAVGIFSRHIFHSLHYLLDSAHIPEPHRLIHFYAKLSTKVKEVEKKNTTD